VVKGKIRKPSEKIEKTKKLIFFERG
jgi:hypothetical protein